MHDRIFDPNNNEPAHHAQCPSHRQEADLPTTHPVPVRNQRNPSRLVTFIRECITHTSLMTLWRNVGQGNLLTFSDNTGTVGNFECVGGGNHVEKQCVYDCAVVYSKCQYGCRQEYQRWILNLEILMNSHMEILLIYVRDYQKSPNFSRAKRHQFNMIVIFTKLTNITMVYIYLMISIEDITSQCYSCVNISYDLNHI